MSVIDVSEVAPTPQNSETGGLQPTAKPRKPGTFVSGDPRAGRNGGRPPVLREIQRMLDEEHRNVDKMRETFARLRALAMGEATIVAALNQDGTAVELKAELKADSRFMALYLAYTIGPPKVNETNDVVEELQRVLADAPPEVMQYILRTFQRRG